MDRCILDLYGLSFLIAPEYQLQSGGELGFVYATNDMHVVKQLQEKL